MSTPDFFRSRLDQMIDLRHPLAVLSTRLPWASIEAAIAPELAHQAKPAKRVIGDDLAGVFDGEFGGGISPAGRPRLPIRLMVSLLYLQRSFNLSDEELVERWAENVQWQFIGGIGLLRAPPAVRRVPDRALQAPPGRGRAGAVVQSHDRMRGRHQGRAPRRSRARDSSTAPCSPRPSPTRSTAGCWRSPATRW